MFSYWGPKAVTFMFKLPPGHADLIFGAVTVLTGIFGTFLGGTVLDYAGGGSPAAAGVCVTSVLFGFAFLQIGFLSCRTLWPFVGLFAAGELMLFMVQAPVTRIILLSAPTALQPMAFSVQTISIHVLGDVPSPPLAGWLHDHLFDTDDVVRTSSDSCCTIPGPAFSAVL
jgi:MFS transporter, Spinster family, sphingosine-1-phosphate transporter